MRAILVTLVLAGCSTRGDFVVVPDALSVGAAETVLVATTREMGPEGFGFERSEATQYLSYQISIPPDREPGKLNWPPKTRKPDPSRDFLTVGAEAFQDGPALRRALDARLLRDGLDTAVIYVHGFNNTMAEGIYRVAQMHYDLKVPAAAIHYSWPSRGSVLGYVHDRESVMFARSSFAGLIDEVAASGADEVYIVAHSMGALLTMEALRQIALRGDNRVMRRISGVVLIAPDLDLDVFRSQARDIGRLPEPFVIFGSSRDRILSLSAKLSGETDRLGNLDDIAEIADLNITYVDTSAYNTGTGHLNVGTNPALISLLGGIDAIDAALRTDERTRRGLLPGLVLTVRNATEIVLSPVQAIANGP